MSSTKNWQNSYEQLQDFLAQHKRLPAAPDGPLNRWVERQRVAHRRGALSRSHESALEQVLAWRWTE